MRKLLAVMLFAFLAPALGFGQSNILKGYFNTHFKVYQGFYTYAAFSVENAEREGFLTVAENGATVVKRIELQKACKGDWSEVFARPDECLKVKKIRLELVSGVGPEPVLIAHGKNGLEVLQAVKILPGEAFPLPIPFWWRVTWPSTLAVSVNYYTDDGKFIGSTYSQNYTLGYGYNFHYPTWVVTRRDLITPITGLGYNPSPIGFVVPGHTKGQGCMGGNTDPWAWMWPLPTGYTRDENGCPQPPKK